jgi:hypothetical protein
MLAEASPGPGERIVVAPIDVSALRHERRTRMGHHMSAHLRTEAYDVYRTTRYPPRQQPDAPLTYGENVRRIDVAKAQGVALPGAVGAAVVQSAGDAGHRDPAAAVINSR